MEELKKQSREKEEKTNVRICKYCKSEVQIKTGSSNWKNLFRKPTIDEWITLFIILMVILSSYAYRNDINNLNKYYNDENYFTQRIQLEQQDINLDELQPEGFLNPSGLNLDGS